MTAEGENLCWLARLKIEVISIFGILAFVVWTFLESIQFCK